MKENILGRESEKELLSQIYESKRSEFVAVCGRRRVGKTFLVREFFEEEMFFFNVLERQMQVLRSSWKVSSTRFVDMTVCMPTDIFSTCFFCLKHCFLIDWTGKAQSDWLVKNRDFFIVCGAFEGMSSHTKNVSIATFLVFDTFFLSMEVLVSKKKRKHNWIILCKFVYDMWRIYHIEYFCSNFVIKLLKLLNNKNSVIWKIIPIFASHYKQF